MSRSASAKPTDIPAIHLGQRILILVSSMLAVAVYFTSILIASTEIMGEAASITILVSTTKWVDTSPKLAEAMFAAMQAAMQRIKIDRRRAAEIYLKNEPSKMTLEFVEKLLADPENTYTVQPSGIMAYADFMHRTGQLKDKPATWEDAFFQFLRA